MKLRLAKFFLTALGLVLTMRAATLAEIAANPHAWPVDVTVTAAARGVIIEKGQPAGAMLIGAGKKLVVTAITAEGVTGKVGGATVRVPVEKTDLLARLGPLPDSPPPEGTLSAVAASEPKPPTGATTDAPSIMQRRLAGKLVRLQGGKVVAADATALASVKYYALYYSASWCGPCKAFTPDLVKAYAQLKAQHPEFEIVFISSDQSADAMRDYMREDRMAWLALKYDQRDSSGELMRYGGPGIPCLVLVDAKGAVLADSFEGGNYVGPRKVLADATRLLKKRG